MVICIYDMLSHNCRSAIRLLLLYILTVKIVVAIEIPIKAAIGSKFICSTFNSYETPALVGSSHDYCYRLYHLLYSDLAVDELSNFPKNCQE